MKNKGIKNLQTEILSKQKWYNPNNFNGTDSALACIITIASFTIFTLIIGLIIFFIPPIWDICMEFPITFSLFTTVALQALLFAIAYAFSKIRKTSIFTGGGYTIKFNGVQILMGFVLTLGVMLTFMNNHMYVSNYMNEYFNGNTTVPMPDEINILEGLSGFILIFIVTPIFPAIFEEMVFRGIIMRGLEQFGAVTAVLLSALMFSFTHGSFDQMLLQFIGGITIGGVAIITKNFLLPITMHFFNNSFSTVYGIIQQIFLELGDKQYYIFEVFCIFLGTACLIIGIIYFGRIAFNNYKNGKLENQDSKFKQSNCYCQTSIYDAYTYSESVHCSVSQKQTSKNEFDSRLFLIDKKFRPLNKKSNSYLALSLCALAIFITLVRVFFQI